MNVLEKRLLWSAAMDPTHIAIVNSDASSTMLGGINSENGKFFSCKVPKHLENADISVLEMEAFEKSVESCDSKRNTHFIGIIDNAAVVSAVNRGTSKNAEVKKRAVKLLEEDMGNYYSSCYINTKRNFIPDALSRNGIKDAKGYALALGQPLSTQWHPY